MTNTSKQPPSAERRTVRVVRKLGRWIVQGTVSGAVREGVRYALYQWVEM